MRTRPQVEETVMIETLGNLIQALRNELQQFGEMLASLDAPGASLDQSLRIQTQAEVLRLARQERRECQRRTAVALNLAGEASIAALAPAMPKEYRPLLLALIHENDELLESLRTRLGQNQSQMSRSLGVMEELMASLSLSTADEAPDGPEPMVTPLERAA
jgi:hypothetical protein